MTQFLERRHLSDRLIYAVLLAAFFAMPLGTSPFTITEGALIAVWVFFGAFWTLRRDYLEASWFWPVLLIVILKGVGLIYTPDLESGLGFAKKAHYWLVPFALSGLRPSIKGAHLLLYSFLAGLFVNACVAFLQVAKIVPVFVSISQYGYLGFYGGYNTLAILLILGMLTASHFFRNSSESSKKWLFGFLTAVFFLHMTLIDSRGGYLVFVAVCPLIIYNLLPKPSIRWTTLVCVLLMGAMLASPVVRHRVAHTLAQVHGHFSADESVRWGKSYSNDLDRIYMWRWAVDLFLENPLLGVGTGGYSRSMVSGGGQVGIPHPHNSFLHMAVSHGIPGVVSFVWLFFVLVRTGWRHRRSAVGFFTLSSTLVILIGSVTETHILDAGGAFLLAVTTGVQTSLQHGEKVSA